MLQTEQKIVPITNDIFISVVYHSTEIDRERYNFGHLLSQRNPQQTVVLTYRNMNLKSERERTKNNKITTGLSHKHR